MGLLQPFVIILLLFEATLADYSAERAEFIAKEYSCSIGMTSHIQLNELELKANEVLMKYALNEFYSGAVNPLFYPALQPAPQYIKTIPSSKVFRIIKAMPKGANLHAHSFAMSSAEFIFSVTYRKNLWVCDDVGKPFQLKFFDKPDCTCNWTLVADKRKNDLFYDDILRNRLSLIKPYPYTITPEVSADIRRIIVEMMGMKDVFGDYIYATIAENYAEGCKYLEIRCMLKGLYGTDGKFYDRDYIVQLYRKTLARFQKKHPDFIGVSVIYIIPRNVNDQELAEYLAIFLDMRQKYGNFVIGIDFDGDEIYGKRLKDLAKGIIEFRKNNELDLYLHAGVTSWFGIWADENLFDAVLLCTKRISHACALAKHPLVMEKVIEKDICIEVAPLADYFHGTYENIQNHPASQFGSYSVPFVLSNGNPGMYEVTGLAYDWYLAFMGFANGNDDLRYLKAIALNSIKYAGVSHDERGKIMESFLKDWDAFILKLSNDEIV